jgi:hypothetical protein
VTGIAFLFTSLLYLNLFCAPVVAVVVVVVVIVAVVVVVFLQCLNLPLPSRQTEGEAIVLEMTAGVSTRNDSRCLRTPSAVSKLHTTCSVAFLVSSH